jgi:hypothetical protein
MAAPVPHLQVLSPNNRVLFSPRVLNHVGVTTMERLDQGHLHYVTDMSRLGVEPRPPWWEASTLEGAIRTAYLIAIRNL